MISRPQVVREPVRRFVSYYFWRWRDKSTFREVSAWISPPTQARLASTAPTFEAFVKEEAPLDGYYVRRLLGIDDPTRRRVLINETHLHRAKTRLSDLFSLILITERLVDFEPLLSKVLGWDDVHFASFYRKSNPSPDLSRLATWRSDWREELRRQMPLDAGFYDFANRVADRRLEENREAP